MKHQLRPSKPKSQTEALRFTLLAWICVVFL
ncbi:MAG: seryl-tRNA synthetase, partial [Bacteroidetes bacterium]